MRSKKSLGDRFVTILEANGITHSSKIFNLGGKLYLPDFVFNYFIVEVLEEVTKRKLASISEFKRSCGGYKIVLLTNDKKHMVEGADHFDEVFDFDSIKVLIAEIKKNIQK
jgi:hypothetical protein